MLTLATGAFKDCSGTTRRQFVQVGGLSMLGLALPDFLRLRQLAAATGKSGKNSIGCIFLWMRGGASHIDTFDPKPDAVSEIRGEFGTIPTTLPGVRITDQLPLLSRHTDKFSIIRGHMPMSESHGTADSIMMTGRKQTTVITWPSHGAVVARERSPRNGMPSFMQLNNDVDKRFGGGVAGYLGSRYNPVVIRDNANAPTFKIRELDGDAALLGVRHRLFTELDRYQKAVDRDIETIRSQSAFHEQAYNLITSPVAKKALDLSQESDRTRDAYGRHRLGQSCLLARRLIEAGVHFVTVSNGDWDTHNDHFARLKGKNPSAPKRDDAELLPRLDSAYSALLNDLSSRGLLATTLVVWCGDFGRTPKIDRAPTIGGGPGRDHWDRAGTICIGGGGVKTGTVVGATDKIGAFVENNPVKPMDLAATIYHALGIPLDTVYPSRDGRPIDLVADGKPVEQLFA
jgi:uncharacterized protein (DUF1501 family)